MQQKEVKKDKILNNEKRFLWINGQWTSVYTPLDLFMNHNFHRWKMYIWRLRTWITSIAFMVTSINMYILLKCLRACYHDRYTKCLKWWLHQVCFRDFLEFHCMCQTWRIYRTALCVLRTPASQRVIYMMDSST